MPKLVDHDLYRQELLDRCFDLFAEKGYAAITMRQIASGLQVSTGTLYHYFPSKEAIFEQLVEVMAERDILQVSQMLHPAQTLSERLAIAFDYLEANRAYYFKQVLIFLDFYQHQQRTQAPPNPVLSRACQRVEQAITELLGLADPAMTTLIYSVIDGWLISQIYGDEPVSIVEQGKFLTQLITTHLAQPAPFAQSSLPVSSPTHSPIHCYER